MAVIFYPPRNTGGGGGGGAATWGSITGTLSSQTDLQTALNGKSDVGHIHTNINSLVGFATSENTSAPNNTVNASRLLVVASTTNADFVIEPKGTGAIIGELPDSAIAGGNKRGANAIDLQLSRTLATQVASGVSSALVGGTSNIANGTSSGVFAGNSNTATRSNTVILGGGSNSITGTADNASILAGSSNSNSGASASIIGGQNNIIDNSGYTAIISGQNNQITGGSGTCVIVGGQSNVLTNALGSVILGGRGFTAQNYNILGFNANINGTRNISIDAAVTNTAVFNNVDLWLSNNDNTPRTLRFYEQYNSAGVFPNGTNYVAFRAPNSIATNVTWTLPNADGTNGQVLQTNGTGTLSWATAGGGLTGFTGSINTTSPNATINVSQLLVAASSTNADAAIVVKGTGSLMLNMPDNTATGGNKRGTNAVDLQFGRGSASQVAEGQNSAILGGLSNTTAGQRSAIVGGIANTTNSNNSVVLGGSQNTTSISDNCTVLGGTNNTSAGSSSAILGGDFNQASSTQSAIVGGNSNQVSGGSSTSVIVGGESNAISASIGSVILGGEGFTAGGNYVLGFNANNQTGSRSINIGTVTDTVVFNNADLWLSNNDNVTSVLRFYEQYNTAGAFPNVANFVGLRAPNSIASNITWVLPNADGTNGQALQTDGSGNLSWGGPTFKTKPSDQSVTNSTVVINDNTFSFDIGTSGSWYLELNLLLDIPASTNFRWRLSGPAGATGVGSMKVGSSATEAITSDAFLDNILTVTAASGTNLAHVEIFARVIAGGTAGTVVLQWAQGTANLGSLTVRGGRSRMIASRNS